MTVKEQLITLEKHLNVLRAPILSLLNPPLTANAVEKNFSSVNYTMPKSLLTFYEWHNGIDLTKNVNNAFAYMFPGFYPLSLQESVNLHRQFSQSINHEANWFPVFENGGGDFYLMALDQESHDDLPIIYFCRDDSEHQTTFSSLQNLLRVINICFEKKIIHLDNDGYLANDFHEFFEVAADLNPSLYQR